MLGDASEHLLDRLVSVSGKGKLVSKNVLGYSQIFNISSPDWKEGQSNFLDKTDVNHVLAEGKNIFVLFLIASVVQLK